MGERHLFRPVLGELEDLCHCECGLPKDHSAAHVTDLQGGDAHASDRGVHVTGPAEVPSPAPAGPPDLHQAIQAAATALNDVLAPAGRLLPEQLEKYARAALEAAAPHLHADLQASRDRQASLEAEVRDLERRLAANDKMLWATKDLAVKAEADLEVAQDQVADLKRRLEQAEQQLNEYEYLRKTVVRLLCLHPATRPAKVADVMAGRDLAAPATPEVGDG